MTCRNPPRPQRGENDRVETPVENEFGDSPSHDWRLMHSMSGESIHAQERRARRRPMMAFWSKPFIW
jgi:hypothetical protein